MKNKIFGLLMVMLVSLSVAIPSGMVSAAAPDQIIDSPAIQNPSFVSSDPDFGDYEYLPLDLPLGSAVGPDADYIRELYFETAPVPFTGVKGLLESISFFLPTSTGTISPTALATYKSFFEGKGYTVASSTGPGYELLHVTLTGSSYIDVYNVEDPFFPFVFVAYVNPDIQNPTSDLVGGTKYGSSFSLKLQNGATGADYARVLYTTDGTNPDCVTNNGTSYDYNLNPTLTFATTTRLAVIGCLKSNLYSDIYIYNYNLVNYSALNFKYDNYFGGYLNQPTNRPVNLRITDPSGNPVPNLVVRFEIKNGANWQPVKDANKKSLFTWDLASGSYKFNLDANFKPLKTAAIQQFRAVLPDGTSFPVLIKTVYSGQ